jgi:hypothetical protein
MNGAIRAHVVLGGKLVGYTGRWPGIVEEAYLLLKAKKPLFLIGGFGGAAGWLARVVLQETREVPPSFSEALPFFQQVSHQDFRNGLEPDENDVLLRSTSLAEILALLVQGFVRLTRNGGGSTQGE